MTTSEEKIAQLESDAKMREVYDLRVYIVGGGFQYAKMFFDAGLKGARSVMDADIICFTGGSDVNPALYGEKNVASHFDPQRDIKEKAIFEEAKELGKPMIGICRGSQFLNVMNGGKLWQDVNNHAIGRGHSLIHVKTGDVKDGMTSTHHQMMRPTDKAEIIAVAGLSTKKIAENDMQIRTVPDTDDIEVVWYQDSLCLCFQPHPEFMHGDCRDYFLDLVDSYILPAC
jgi:gamma-glutamyl-gamma-aminobutyrate hydrolase PuuD